MPGLKKSGEKPPKVLLISPPIYDFALYDLYLKPYALLKLASRFRRAGYEVELLDCLSYREPVSRARLGSVRRRSRDGTGKFFRQVVDKPPPLQGTSRHFCRYGILHEVIRSRLQASNPDLILVSSGMTYWYPGVQEVIRAAKEIHRRVPVVLGGIYATLCGEHAERVMPADFIIQGEASPGLDGVLARLALPPIGGEGQPLLLPEVFGDSAVLRINKGCPFRCHYCCSHFLSGSFVQGDGQAAFELVSKIHHTLGTRVFAFYDDALLVKKQEVLIPFLERVVEAKLPLSFYLPNALHLAFMEKGVADLMFRAGFQELRFGFESSSSDFHENFDGKFEVDDFGGKVELLLEAGFSRSQISLYILAGLPGQSTCEVEQSIRYAATFGVKVYLAEYSPIPGSPLWERSVAESVFPIAREPLTHNNSLLPMRRKDFSLEDLKRLKALTLKLCRRNI